MAVSSAVARSHWCSAASLRVSCSAHGAVSARGACLAAPRLQSVSTSRCRQLSLTQAKAKASALSTRSVRAAASAVEEVDVVEQAAAGSIGDFGEDFDYSALLGEEDDFDLDDEEEEEEYDDDSEDEDEKEYINPEDFEQSVIQVRRVTKVVKGGKQLKFRAVVIVGNGRGKVGVGCQSAKEVQVAVERSERDAMENLVDITMTRDQGLPHKMTTAFGAARVMLRPAALGTGVVAGGAVRTVLELAGVQNCLGKQLGSTNQLNNARATVKALLAMRLPEQVAEQRGVPVNHLLGIVGERPQKRRQQQQREEDDNDVEPFEDDM